MSTHRHAVAGRDGSTPWEKPFVKRSVCQPASDLTFVVLELWIAGISGHGAFQIIALQRAQHP
jgi:hypothetical protein